MDALINIGIFLILLTLGYSAGRHAERKHYRSIVRREKRFLQMPAVTLKGEIDGSREIDSARMVMGSVVISIDYFKRFLASLRNLFGGNVVSYESLIDRARREAILRMKEDMPEADIIVNTRVETSVIGASANQKGTVGSIEVLAWGTAVKYQKT